MQIYLLYRGLQRYTLRATLIQGSRYTFTTLFVGVNAVTAKSSLQGKNRACRALYTTYYTPHPFLLLFIGCF
jgi:hypothetical protein